MVEKISAEQSYMNYMMSKIPEVERGEEYKIKKGDSLWNIVKNNLASPKAKNSEIQDYMYQIAKLNNINTIEELNSLRALESIYLPKQNSAKKTSRENENGSHVSNPQRIGKVSQSGNVKSTSVSVAEPRSTAETSILSLTEQIKTDKTITIEKMYKSWESSNDLYNVYCVKKDPQILFYSRKHSLVSFTVDRRTGNIIMVSFNEQPVAKNSIMYDYDLFADGSIKTHDNTRRTNQGKLTSEELNNLHSQLKAIVSANFK